MSSTHTLFCGVALVSVLAASGQQSQAQVPTRHQEPQTNPTSFTIQVASFPSFAEAKGLISQLEATGERPLWSEVEIPGRGKWTRVFIGSFESARAASVYARGLAARGVIRLYLVKPAVEKVFESLKRAQAPAITRTAFHEARSGQPTMVSLPAPARNRVLLANPTVDEGLIPRPDPVLLAFRNLCNTGQGGGLWLTGDVEEGLARLRWIAGPGREDLLSADSAGRVHVDAAKLALAAGVNRASADAPLAVAGFITSDEGLLLLVQVTEGSKRYLLNLGKRAETFDASAEVSSSINLDNGFDSRINPARKNRQKLGNERPPAGFDCLIVINPSAHWAKVTSGRLVPDGMVAFHELAEAYSKVEQGLQYLADSSRPGAHSIAIEREIKLQSSTIRSGVVLTAGINRVFKSEKDLAALRAQSVAVR
ncbi:MAG TPA: SPOR domain-containing protein [Blastocatellia bacterium]|jgi:hypothetical protein|nr:SPOR domain-containing protein [Blastocatellia bacterium]